MRVLEGRCARKRKSDVGNRMGTLEKDEKDGNIYIKNLGSSKKIVRSEKDSD